MEEKIKKLPDNELRSLASGDDVDTARIANQILLERLNRKSETIGRLGAAVEREYSFVLKSSK